MESSDPLRVPQTIRSVTGSGKARRDGYEVHKRNYRIDSGRDAGSVSSRSSHAFELKGLFWKEIEEKNKAWQMCRL